MDIRHVPDEPIKKYSHGGVGNNACPRMAISRSFLPFGRTVFLRLAMWAVVVTQSAYAQPPVRQGQTVHGEAAIAALGARLPDVARDHGLSPDTLAARFRIQRGLGIDAGGALLFSCEAPAVPPAQAPVGEGSLESPVTSPGGDPFRLHSFPGASRVIYLDFNGHTTSGTQWNSKYTGGADIVSQPFDIDGNPYWFGTTEQDIIRGIWQRVAEDYAPFAIDVTTEDPGIEALRRSSTGDEAYGVRVIISPTNWYSGGAGGVAYVGSFNWNSDTPCFAFSTQLANSENYIAESAAHEAGHTL